MVLIDQMMVDSAGVFFQNELERVDPLLNEPLVNYTWTRDVSLRTDVSIADEIASYSYNAYSHAGSTIGGGKNFIAPNDTAIAGPSVDVSREGNPLHLWASEVMYTVVELAKAAQINRPLDMQMVDAMKLKWQMDNDEMVYRGDTQVGAEGLLNSAQVPLVPAINNGWGPGSGITPDDILLQFNQTLTTAWENSAYAAMPNKVLVSPNIYSVLVGMKVSTAGNLSVINYLQENNILRATTGETLQILPVKWAYQGGADTTWDRMFFYNDSPRFVQYPMVPLQKTPIQHRGIHLVSVYYGKMGHVEFRYPTTMAYTDVHSW